MKAEISLHCKTAISELRLPGLQGSDIGLFLWRDDLIHPLIQGNKWRKLKYYLITYRKEGINQLVSCGGAWSNHLHALAASAKQFDFRLSVFVRAHEGVNTEMLEDLKRWNVQIIFCSREEYRMAESGDAGFISNKTGRSEFGFIPSGGFGAPAMEGLREMAEEIGEDWPLIAVAAGSGTTSLGLSAHLAPHQCVLAYSAFPEASAEQPAKSSAFAPARAQLRTYPSEMVYRFAHPRPEVLAFAEELYQLSGIVCDPVYTGPMLLQLSRQIQGGHFPKGSRILAIHSGGLQGWRGLSAGIPPSLRSALQGLSEPDFPLHGQ